MAATLLRMPVSATHSIVGATVGFALVAMGTRGINWGKLAMISEYSENLRLIHTWKKRTWKRWPWTVGFLVIFYCTFALEKFHFRVRFPSVCMNHYFFPVIFDIVKSFAICFTNTESMDRQAGWEWMRSFTYDFAVDMMLLDQHRYLIGRFIGGL